MQIFAKQHQKKILLFLAPILIACGLSTSTQPDSDPDFLDDNPNKSTTFWEKYGTRGRSPNSLSKTCMRDDIRKDDLVNYDSMLNEINIPDWHKPQLAAKALCGDSHESILFRLSNCERISNGLTPLNCDLRLVWISREHSKDMGENNFFAHVNLAGKDPFDRMHDKGIPIKSAAENIAQNTNPFSAHQSWMASSGHRKNILSKNYEYIGIGSFNSKQRFYYTQAFIVAK